MQRKMWVAILVLVLVSWIGVAQVAAQGPLPGAPRLGNSAWFTYQGQLKSGGTPYTGSCDFQFGLYDSPTLGNQIGITQTAANLLVTNGLFTTPLTFGLTAFDGSPRYLDIGVSCPSAGPNLPLAYTPLTPRQPLTAAPFALFATNAGSVSGVVSPWNGGTGLTDPGGSGHFLRSTGYSWNSSTIQAIDLPSGSANYIQNTTSWQNGANFNISGSGTLGGVLNMYMTSPSPLSGMLNLGGDRFLHRFGPQNTFLGPLAGNLSMTGGNNAAVGSNVLAANTIGSFNAVLGANALTSNTIGNSNTALGNAALYSNTMGSYNTGIGASALFSNTNGYRNAAVGYNALYANTTGGQNTAVGSYALESNSTGGYNTALGGYALSANTVGQYNAALGVYALQDNITGTQNIALGPNALRSNTTGNANIAAGLNALNGLNGGSQNIAVGVSAGGAYTGTESYNIVIGNNGTVGDSYTIRIGSNQTSTVIAGIWGKTSSGGIPVNVNASGQLGTSTSSQRFKDNIRDMGKASEILYQLRPVNFTYKPEYGGSPDEMQAGLIAEEVAAVAPWMVLNDENGRPYTVRYELLAPMLVNEIQEQRGTIQSQASEIADLRAQVATTNGRLDALENAVAQASPVQGKSGLDGLSAPLWALAGIVGLLVGQRVWRGGNQ